MERGWVEKLPAHRMNLTRLRNGATLEATEVNKELDKLLLSHRVEKYDPNFIWRTKDQVDNTIDMNKVNTTITNHLTIDAQWTTKQGLCSSMNRNNWFYIDDVAEVNGPRTYNTYDSEEVDEFITDYKLTACTSLLKWVLNMSANETPIFMENGNISTNVLVFALNRCKEYLYRKQNKDIDNTITPVSTMQWNAFLKRYYRIVEKEEQFRQDMEHELRLYLNYAKFLLNEMRKYRPQIDCEGYHNVWIIKPAHCSRGRGIRLASKLNVITDLIRKANAKYVIQKYIGKY